MALKLKLNTGKASSPESTVPPTPSTGGTPGSGTGLKLKISASQPATPASEIPVSAKPKIARASTTQTSRGGKSGGGSKKRAANDDTISPAPKRANRQPTGPTRKISLKGPVAPSPSTAGGESAPPSAGSSGKLHLRRKSTQPKLRTLNVKQRPPPRIPGHGYDSEDSEAEEDPAIQQAFILRMEPGEDCEYIRDAIANGKIGLPPNEDPAEVSMRFVEKDNRRAIVTVRGRMYAAVLVDLPCIVETMKSWDRKGWWKVADICQMLLVLGRCSNEEEARKFPLPRDVDKDTLQYAHGLTAPMKWVRKRRFRKRLSYKTIANVEEEVERLLKEDEVTEFNGGKVEVEVIDQRDLERSQEPDPSQIGEDDAIETVENPQEEDEYYDEDDDLGDVDLEGHLQAMFDEDHANASSATPAAADLISDSPRPLADQAATFAAVENAMAQPLSDSPAAAATPASGDDNGASPSSDEDEEEDEESDEDSDSPDVMDEDAAAAAAERNQQLQEVVDLEKEVEAQRIKMANTTNQLLKQRMVAQLRTLEEDLRVKKNVLGVGDGEEGMDGADDED